MKRILALLLLSFLLFGCDAGRADADSGLSLRNALQSASGCTFQCDVTADYGDSITRFVMACVWDRGGEMTFTVQSPQTIADITGKMSAKGGTLTFDDKVLLVQPLAEGQLTPICGPWLMVRTLQGGIIRASGKMTNGVEIIYDDVYNSEPFQMITSLDESGYPVNCEFIWQGQQILTVKVEDFTIV